MSVEVIIPSLRQGEVERLVLSLLLQTQVPDVVTVVSNETQPFSVGDRTAVRLLRFSSEEYCIGEYDVTLRQNVGVFSSECGVIIIQGDDQIAPATMVEDSLAALEGKEYVWGNHRLLSDLGGRGVEDVLRMTSSEGLSRENPTPPALHGHYSCYGGMFVTRTEFIREFGAFDMACHCRHANEDQQLGYRLMRKRGENSVLIHEPPFSWHDIALREGRESRSTRDTWLEPERNGCGQGSHDLFDETIADLHFTTCRRCTYSAYVGVKEALFRDDPLIRYRPEAVQTSSVWL